MNCSIREIQNIAEVESFIEPHSLVLFDLDHTVIESADIYGHGNWFYDQIRKGEKQGFSADETIRRIFPQWLESQKENRVKMVEERTREVIENLQTRGIRVMGLTARSKELIQSSIRQLASLNIDFGITALPGIQVRTHGDHPVTYHQGILFTSDGYSKAFALKAYLDEIGHCPSHIVAIDDTMGVLERLNEMALQLGLSFTGLHYPLVDNCRHTWDEEEAQRQFDLHKDPKFNLVD